MMYLSTTFFDVDAGKFRISQIYFRGNFLKTLLLDDLLKITMLQSSLVCFFTMELKSCVIFFSITDTGKALEKEKSFFSEDAKVFLTLS